MFAPVILLILFLIIPLCCIVILTLHISKISRTIARIEDTLINMTSAREKSGDTPPMNRENTEETAAVPEQPDKEETGLPPEPEKVPGLETELPIATQYEHKENRDKDADTLHDEAENETKEKIELKAIQEEPEPVAPREPSQIEIRLKALRNWLIFGRSDGMSSGESAEKMLATTWLLRSGILVLLFSTVFLLKLSIERGLLAPEGRVAISYLCGALLLGAGLHKKMRSEYWRLGQALAGIGLGMFYFSSFAMVSMYSLVPAAVGGAVMVLVTLTAGLLADRLSSIPIAMVTMLGGYATPLLLNTGQKNIPGLAGYLLLLGIGVLWLSNRRNWQQLIFLAMIFTYILTCGVYKVHFTPEDFPVFQLSLSLLMMLFSTSVFVHNVRLKIQATFLEILGLLCNSMLFFTLSMLAINRTWPEEGIAAAPLTMGLSMFYLLHALLLARRKAEEDRNLLLIFCALSGFYLSLTFPAVLTGEWLGAAWALEALMMLWLGCKMDSRFLRTCAWLLYGATLLRLTMYEFSFYSTPQNWSSTAGSGTFWSECLARCIQYLIPVFSLAMASKIAISNAETANAEVPVNRDSETAPSVTSGANIISGIFISLAFILCISFMLMEVNHTLYRAYPMFRTAGKNIVWIAGFITALQLFRRGVPGWWKPCFFIIGTCIIALAVHDFINGSSWICGFPDFLWSYSIGDILNTLVLAGGIWYAGKTITRHGLSKSAAAICSVSWPIILFLHTTRELHTIVENKLPGMTGGGISILWSLFAFAMVMNGLRKSCRFQRYLGLGLFLIVIGKVFLFDIVHLDAAYRVAAFIAFGILLMGAAFVYLRFWHSKEK